MTTYRVLRASDDVIAALGQTVTYDPVSNTWVPTEPASGGASSLAGLSDVDITGASEGDVLTREGGVWVAAAPTGGGAAIQVGGSQPAEGWWLDTGQPLPDTTPPSTPTGLTATATGGSTVDLSWTASTDDVAVTGYHYRIGTGSAVDAGAGTSETVTGLSPLTAYAFQVRAYDAQGNVSGWSTAASATTLAGPDTTAPTPGTLAASAITSTTFTLTVTGASDEVGLHATPYAFSTDNGATWSAWQAGATYDVTGKVASTGYQCQHKVRDAALNEATGAAITVTTSAPAPLLSDDFDRATTTTGGTLGTATSGQVWSDPDANWLISEGEAAPSSLAAHSAYLPVGAADMDVSVKVRFATESRGANDYGILLLRCASGGAGYRAQIRSTDISLAATSDGGAATVAITGGAIEHTFAEAISPTKSYVIRVKAKTEGGGVRLTLYVDGVEIEDVLDTAAKPSGTNVGIRNGWNYIRFDDLTVHPV